jgi:hypothetical protein
LSWLRPDKISQRLEDEALELILNRVRDQFNVEDVEDLSEEQLREVDHTIHKYLFNTYLYDVWDHHRGRWFENRKSIEPFDIDPSVRGEGMEYAFEKNPAESCANNNEGLNRWFEELYESLKEGESYSTNEVSELALKVFKKWGLCLEGSVKNKDMSLEKISKTINYIENDLLDVRHPSTYVDIGAFSKKDKQLFFESTLINWDYFRRFGNFPSEDIEYNRPTLLRASWVLEYLVDGGEVDLSLTDHIDWNLSNDGINDDRWLR